MLSLDCVRPKHDTAAQCSACHWTVCDQDKADDTAAQWTANTEQRL